MSKELLGKLKNLNETILAYYQNDINNGYMPDKIFQRVFKNSLSNKDTIEKNELSEFKKIVNEIYKISFSVDFIVGYLEDYGWREKTARSFVNTIIHSKM